MAFTKNLIPNQHWQEFSFFTTGDPDVDGSMDEVASFVGAFKLAELRLAFSGVASADIVLRMYVSSIQGTVHNLLLLSATLNNSQYYRWQPLTVPMLFLSGDTLLFSQLSDNTYSLNVSGWATIGVEP